MHNNITFKPLPLLRKFISSLTLITHTKPKPKDRVTERAIASEAQIQSPTHSLTTMLASPSPSEGSFSSTPPSSYLFNSSDPSLFLPRFHLAPIQAHPLTLSLILKSTIMKMRVNNHAQIAPPQPVPHPHHRCPKWFIYIL